MGTQFAADNTEIRVAYKEEEMKIYRKIDQIWSLKQNYLHLQ